MSYNKIYKLAGIFTLSLLLLSNIFAQASDNGGLQGTVLDIQNAVVPNATVTVKNPATGLSRTTTTNSEGRWKLTTLPLGRYEITVTAEGFAETKQTAIVEAATSNEVTIALAVEGVGVTTVNVGNEGGVDLINTENSGTISTSITGEKIEKSITVNRNVTRSLTVDSAVSAGLGNPNDNGSGNAGLSVNGGRETSTSVTLDGTDATSLVGESSTGENISLPPEAVQEVKLLSNYDASLGRSGSGSVQIVSRSGGNQFNGSAYFYFQNEKFNANDFFYNRDGIDRQVARRYEGGITLGGRLIRDKLFFFSTYQKTDAKTAYVPSAQSFVVLPEALAFITDRSDPENVRQAFVQSVNLGGVGTVFRNGSSCIRTLTPMTPPTTTALTCIDPNSVGFRLLNTINPVTGGFLIPELTQGRFQRLYLDEQNVGVFINGQRTTDFSAFGLPNGLPLLDATFQGQISGGLPLVRFRNVFPAEFKQDQFSTRLDYVLSKGNAEGNGANNLSGSFFFSDFPSLDPFSDDTLITPQPLIKDDKNRTLAIKDTHIFSGTLINEARFGLFYLDNSRELDERFEANGLTNAEFGITNPATFFVPGPQSQRLARFVGTGNLSDFSLNAPNDIYNQRKQITLTFADNVTYIPNEAHTIRFGFEHKRNFYDTNLPEEQGIEFEGLLNFTQLLTGFVPEADVALGITDKQFRFKDYSLYITDDYRFNERLTVNIGLRWDLFGLPVEKNGRFTNLDFDRITDPNNILPGFILPSNSQDTGFNAIDASLASIDRVDTKHTLNGQDLNNFAPRIGFAFRPFKSGSTLIRGGYGIFYDRPSAGFINTIYSNYPYFNEIEFANEFRPNAVQGRTAFEGIDPTNPFVNNFPFFVGLTTQADTSPYILRDNSPGSLSSGSAEPLEFRAIDRNLKTPMVQQWNLGIQQEFKGWNMEARYVGTRGQNLLLAVGFNQPYDLNDPNTPDYIYGRLNDALSAVFPGLLPPRTPGVSERDRGTTLSSTQVRAFGACNPAFGGNPNYIPCNGGAGGIDLNLTSFDFDTPRAIINAAVRVPYLGLDPTDAVILQSRGYSIYHAGQFNLTKRFATGFSFNTSYTFSKSIDIGSTDPGSTAASGRPDTANLGLVVQGDQRNLNSNRAVSDFDRPHRFSSSFTWEIPTFGSKSKFATGWELSGFGQWQSGTPFSIFASDADFFPQASGGAFLLQYLGIIALVTERNTPIGGTFREERYNVGAGSGTIFNTGFGRPSVRSLELLREQFGDGILQYFNTCQDPNDTSCALISPLGGFGNLGRNTLRGPSQKRFDISLQKTTKFMNEKLALEFKWDIFNVLNLVNFANPNSDLNDETDFGQITRTVGAPRVMNFGLKLRF